MSSMRNTVDGGLKGNHSISLNVCGQSQEELQLKIGDDLIDSVACRTLKTGWGSSFSNFKLWLNSGEKKEYVWLSPEEIKNAGLMDPKDKNVGADTSQPPFIETSSNVDFCFSFSWVRSLFGGGSGAGERVVKSDSIYSTGVYVKPEFKANLATRKQCAEFVQNINLKSEQAKKTREKNYKTLLGVCQSINPGASELLFINPGTSELVFNNSEVLREKDGADVLIVLVLKDSDEKISFVHGCSYYEEEEEGSTPPELKACKVFVDQILEGERLADKKGAFRVLLPKFVDISSKLNPAKQLDEAPEERINYNGQAYSFWKDSKGEIAWVGSSYDRAVTSPSKAQQGCRNFVDQILDKADSNSKRLLFQDLLGSFLRLNPSLGVSSTVDDADFTTLDDGKFQKCNFWKSVAGDIAWVGAGYDAVDKSSSMQKTCKDIVDQAAGGKDWTSVFKREVFASVIEHFEDLDPNQEKTVFIDAEIFILKKDENGKVSFEKDSYDSPVDEICKSLVDGVAKKEKISDLIQKKHAYVVLRRESITLSEQESGGGLSSESKSVDVEIFFKNYVLSEIEGGLALENKNGSRVEVVDHPSYEGDLSDDD